MRKKRLFGILIAFVLALGVIPAMASTALAAPDSSPSSFTITFKSSNSNDNDGSKAQTQIDNIIADGASYVSSLTATNVYNARSGYGIKLGTKNTGGSLLLNLADPVTASSITVEARQYNDSEQTLTLQGQSFTADSEFKEWTYTYSQPTEISSITLGSDPRRLYIKSVTVTLGEATVGVDSVSLTPSTLTLAQGESAALTASIEPDDATDKTVKWSIPEGSDNCIALYSDEGCNTPLELGQATSALTAYVKGIDLGGTVRVESNADSGKYAECSVTVQDNSTETLSDRETPLTLEAKTDGTIVVIEPQIGMQYTLNGGNKQLVTNDYDITITVDAGDIVQFYGNGTDIASYEGNTMISGGDAECYIYGNIMSLVDEYGFDTAETLTEEDAFILRGKNLSRYFLRGTTNSPCA